MTAEIAIMNKEAVALASDSAVTLTEERSPKIFTSANKIFTLSKYRPVGIMIYGNASFMGVPWETIIKIYRTELGSIGFDSLEQYAGHFLEFLKDNNGLFPESEQRNYVEGHIRAYFHYIAEEIDRQVEDVIKRDSKITEEKAVQITSGVIEDQHELWIKTALIPEISEECIRELKDKFIAFIEGVKKELFPKISKRLSDKLTKMAIDLLVKFPENGMSSGFSGIVIAGFGAKDIFPCLRSFMIEGIVGKCLKYRNDRDSKIDFNRAAAIVPFAQSEMVHTFMGGVDPRYQRIIEKDIFQIFKSYPSIIVDKIDKLNKEEKESLKLKLSTIGDAEFQRYRQALESYRRTNYIDPVMKVVQSLPKDELSAMAESLVNLTSFRRKISMDAETVGGPIDVAVISKGDGFIWIKRKQYFMGDLNPQFLANYYKETKDEKR